MTHPFRSVATGQHVTRVGLLMAIWGVGVGVVSAVSGFCCLSAIRPPDATSILILAVVVILGTFGVAAAGLLVGVVGRCMCAFALPEEVPAARAAAKLAAVLDVCGGLNLATTFGVGCAMGWRWVVLPEWIPAAGAGLSLVLIVAARVFFFLALRRLSKYLDDSAALDTANTGRTVILWVTACGVPGVALLSIWGAAPGNPLATIGGGFGSVLVFSAGLMAVWLPFVTAGLLRDLSAACRKHSLTESEP